MIVRKNAGWLTAKIANKVIVMSMRDADYIDLNTIGVRIWEIIDTPSTVEDICAVLLRQFRVPPDICRADVETFLADMERQGAIACEPPMVPPASRLQAY